MVAPLQKKGLNGALYQRPERIEAQLKRLSSLSRHELVRRCAIRSRNDDEYVPEECLLHFVRASQADNSNDHFDRLYKILIERLLRRLPRADSCDGKSKSLKLATIGERMFDRFVERLVEDRMSYSEKLDFFEVHFDSALKRLRQDAQDHVWRDENRKLPLEKDEETGEPTSEVERAVGSFDPFAEGSSSLKDYQSRLDAAIDELPPEQIRIIEMMRQEIPIDSKNPDAVTIAKTLGKSEKTIRLWRDKAFEAIRARLNGGGEE